MIANKTREQFKASKNVATCDACRNAVDGIVVMS